MVDAGKKAQVSVWHGEWISSRSMLLWVVTIVIGTVWGTAVGFELLGMLVRHPRMILFFRVWVCLFAAFWISGRYDLYKHRKEEGIAL